MPTTTKEGYQFKGWSGAGLDRKEGDVSKLTATNNGTVSLTAQFEPNKYTVKFDTDGGEALEDFTGTYDTETALPTPTKAGYTFKGWVNKEGNVVATVNNLTSDNGGVVELK